MIQRLRPLGQGRRYSFCRHNHGQMVTRLRMQHAEQLLMRSDINLERIAEELGYTNSFALSKAFKRERGISPRHYREQMRE